MTVQAEGAQQDEVKEEGCAGSPADKTKFFEALERAGTLRQEDDMCGAWEKFRAVYQQAKSFGALTNAAQQETDGRDDGETPGSYGRVDRRSLKTFPQESGHESLSGFLRECFAL